MISSTKVPESGQYKKLHKKYVHSTEYFLSKSVSL